MAYLDENGLEHFWGKIKDRISSAIAPKADDADVVHKTGDETVEGVKTFQNTAEGHVAGETVTDLVIRNPEVDRGTPVEGGRSYTRVILADREGDTEQTFAGRLGLLEVVSPKENDTIGEELRLECYKYSDNSADYVKYAGFCVGYDKDEIPFSTAPATSDDRTNSTDIVTRGYMEASEWNWKKTKKEPAVQFKPVHESDLEPVVDFMFTETPPASGDKGPSNPSTIAGVTQAKVTRCGKNLCPNVIISRNYNNITVTANADGSLTFNGTAQQNLGFLAYVFSNSTSEKWYNILQRGVNYTFSMSGDAGVSFQLYRDTGSGYGGAAVSITSGETVTYSVPQAAIGLLLRFYVAPGVSVNNATVKMQIEKGSAATAFEPYAGNNYTIQFGDTYYGGSLDVATGVMTVTHVGTSVSSMGRNSIGLVDSWYGHESGTHIFVFYFDRAGLPNGVASSTPDHTNWVCTHFRHSGELIAAGLPNINFFTKASSGVAFYIDIEESKLDLSGAVDPANPTNAELDDAVFALASQEGWFVVYPVAEPYTVQLTPTQIRSLPAIDKYEPRTNTVYTNQEAVQVGYQRFANYVDLTTDQTIKGIKKFYNDSNYTDLVGSTGVTPHFILNSTDVLTKGTAPSRAAHGILPFMPKDHFDYSYDNRLAAIQYMVNTDKTVQISLGVSDFVADSTSYPSVILEKTSADAYCFRPSLDNLLSIGTANRRWTQVFANTATISTSDERLKTSISILPDEVLDAWSKIDFKQFKMSASVEEKGGSARTHCGLIAQDIRRTFEADGLDASAYGLYCYDEWEAQEESKSEDGEVLFPKREAGDQYSLRYEEALCMEAAYMRRENARLKKRIADLEERLAALELKIF